MSGSSAGKDASLSAAAASGPVVPLKQALQAPRTRGGSGEHIVLLVDQFAAVLGGGERVVLRTARMLGEAGFRVSIVTFQVFCDPERLKVAGCPVLLLPLHNVFSPGAVRAAWELGSFLRREKVSVVLTYFESSNLFGGIVTKALSRARLIWNRRDMGILRERKHSVAYRWFHRLPDHVIAVSEEVRRHAIAVDRIPPERVSVVYNGVEDTSAGAPRNWPETPLIVTVGNLRPVKGHDTLVEAAATVLARYPEARVVIAGEPLQPEFVAGMRQRVQELGLDDRVQFPGGVADPGVLLRQASVFVLPSRSEGFSNAIVEAMVAGLPVVATTVGGNAEAVEDGVTGILVPPEQPAALAEALLKILGDPKRMRAMGAAGHARAEMLFSTGAMLRGMTEAFARAKRRPG